MEHLERNDLRRDVKLSCADVYTRGRECLTCVTITPVSTEVPKGPQDSRVTSSRLTSHEKARFLIRSQDPRKIWPARKQSYPNKCERSNRLRIHLKWSKTGAWPRLSTSGMAFMHYYPAEQVLHRVGEPKQENRRLKCRSVLLTCPDDCETSVSEPPTHVVYHVMGLIFLFLDMSSFGRIHFHLKKISIISNIRIEMLCVNRRQTNTHDVKPFMVWRRNDLRNDFSFFFWEKGVREVQAWAHTGRVVSAQMRGDVRF